MNDVCAAVRFDERGGNSVLVIGVTVGLGRGGRTGHDHLPLHAGLVVTGLQAGEVEGSGLRELQINSPVLPASTLAWFGSACSICGNLTISAACSFSCAIGPSTISCLSLPSFFSTKRIV